MKRITILLVVTALLAVPAGALSVKKKSIKRIANPTTTNVAAPTVYQQAVKAYENDDFSTAARLINQHLEKNPNHADGWAYKAAIYSENDNPHEALKAIDMARQCRIDQNKTEFLNWIYFTRSTINLQLSDTVNAIEDLNMALRYDPTDVDSYFRRGNLFKRMRRFDEALVDYGMMVQYDPKEIEGYLGIGTVSGSLKDRKASIKAFSKAIELDPNNAEPYALRAVEYYNDNNFKNAAKDIINSLERESDNARALWLLEYIKEDIKEYEDVAKEVTKVFNDKAKKSKDPSWLDLLK